MLLLLGDGLRRVQGAFAVGVFGRCSLVSALEGAHRVLFLAGDHDDAAALGHLEDVVAVMSHCHKLGQGWIPKDGVVRQTDVSDVEVDELGAVIVALAEGNKKADLPYRCGGAVGHF